MVFWFYFMKVYLVRCQPFNGRHKTHVLCKDRTAAALIYIYIYKNNVIRLPKIFIESSQM
jgi:hypothetical protein